MKALVIGGSGMTGEALHRALELSGVEVVRAYHSRPIPRSLKLDVRDRAAVDACLLLERPNVVFVATMKTGGADRCETHPEEAYDLHVAGTRNVALATRNCKAKLVYYSTDYIFDGRAGPYGEEDLPHPLNVYGLAKWEAERVIQDLLQDYLIIRTAWVYRWNKTSLNFAMQLWNRLHRGETMRVACDQWSNPTLAAYLAEVSVRFVQAAATGIFNVVGKDRMPRTEFAKALCQTMALDPNLVIPVLTSELGQDAPRPLRSGLRTERTQRFLEAEPLNLDESLKRFRQEWSEDTHIQEGSSGCRETHVRT
jgi:dTDP-4-dehydrorhamnose reductase